MISPHTPPGTKVVYLGTSDPTPPGGGQPSTGEVCTLVQIHKDLSHTGFSCDIEGYLHLPHRFCTSLFRRLDLPESLTSLLNTRPVDKEMERNHG